MNIHVKALLTGTCVVLVLSSLMFAFIYAIQHWGDIVLPVVAASLLIALIYVIGRVVLIERELN